MPADACPTPAILIARASTPPDTEWNKKRNSLWHLIGRNGASEGGVTTLGRKAPLPIIVHRLVAFLDASCLPPGAGEGRGNLQIAGGRLVSSHGCSRPMQGPGFVGWNPDSVDLAAGCPVRCDRVLADVRQLVVGSRSYPMLLRMHSQGR